MDRKKWLPQQNSVLAMGLVVCLFLIAGLCFDFYYDLNDDVLIKDIVSGAYNGTPDAHSIQMLYPVSLAISLLYRILPMMPWQGIFLCGCHGICFYFIGKRSISFAKKTVGKIALLLMEGLLVLTLFLWELVVVQYTITAALLAACACFLVFTSEKKTGLLAFLKEQAVPVVLVILAFNIRSEMLLLMSPFIALTGILKWSQEQAVFAKENLKKYLGMIGVILLGMGLSLLIDFVAYGTEDWKAFRDFFDARTKVYDYTWYPDYEEAEAFYQEIGVTPIQLTLIDNYNFGLDDSIDAKLLWDIADYAEKTGVKESFLSQLKNALVNYKWRTFHEEDAPYNFVVLAAYAMVAALALVYRDKSAIWKLPLAVLFRTIPWMYVILANRVPARISHPLYYIELIILCGWMLSYYCLNPASDSQNPAEEALGKEPDLKFTHNLKRSCVVCGVLLTVCALIQLPGMWQKTADEMVRREEVNEKMLALDVFAGQNPGNYYYMDVYSTVPFSEKMFEGVDNTQKNYDILGGWASGSPLQKRATEAFHTDRLSEAELLLLDNFYFVMNKEYNPSFLIDFYASHGMTVELEQTGIVGEGENPFVIYQINLTGM